MKTTLYVKLNNIQMSSIEPLKGLNQFEVIFNEFLISDNITVITLMNIGFELLQISSIFHVNILFSQPHRQKSEGFGSHAREALNVDQL